MRRRRLRGLPRLGLWLLYLLLAALAFRAAASLRRALPGYSLRFAAPVTAAQARALREAAAEGEFEPVFWGLGQGGAVDAGLRAGTAEELLVWGEPVEAAAPGRLTGGGWPSAKDAMGCAVSEALAWRLWGSGDVVGMELKLDGRPYVVRGVFADETERVVRQQPQELGDTHFTAVELLPRREHASLEQAQRFARSAGLAPTAAVDGPALAAAAALVALLPAAVGAAWCAGRLWRQARKSLSSAHRQLLGFALLFALALALPALLRLLPPSLVPARWSDFSFWGQLWQSLAQGAQSWFSLVPSARDVAAKWGLLQTALASGGAAFTLQALWRAPAPEKL